MDDTAIASGDQHGRTLFAAVPLDLIRRLINLEPVASHVFLALAMRADFATGACYPSIATVAQDTGRHPDHVRRIIKQLAGIGALKIERRLKESGRPDSNIYHLRLIPAHGGVSGAGRAGDTGARRGAIPAHGGQEQTTTELPPVELRSRARFVPPTVDQVAAYCSERGNSVDAAQFIDHYTANGWKVGKVPMRDWRASVRTWEKNGMRANSRGTPSETATKGSSHYGRKKTRTYTEYDPARKLTGFGNDE